MSSIDASWIEGDYTSYQTVEHIHMNSSIASMYQDRWCIAGALLTVKQLWLPE
jgi:hypothetical protein